MTRSQLHYRGCSRPPAGPRLQPGPAATKCRMLPPQRRNQNHSATTSDGRHQGATTIARGTGLSARLRQKAEGRTRTLPIRTHAVPNWKPHPGSSPTSRHEQYLSESTTGRFRITAVEKHLLEALEAPTRHCTCSSLSPIHSQDGTNQKAHGHQ